MHYYMENPVAFNRTNLESKQAYKASKAYKAYKLLIAPIWNRNIRRLRGFAEVLDLLIAPIWNRNIYALGTQMFIQDSFNRTNLESKL